LKSQNYAIKNNEQEYSSLLFFYSNKNNGLVVKEITGQLAIEPNRKMTVA